MVDTYTLINGVEEKTIRPGNYQIEYEYGEDITSSDTSFNKLLLDNSNNMCFENPLLFALFDKHKTTYKKTNIKTNITTLIKETYSDNIVIKVNNFGHGENIKDVSFGFITTNEDASANVIFLHSDLFEDIKTDRYDKHDEIRKYALVLLEVYYNDTNQNEKKKIRTLCNRPEQSDSEQFNGGNTTKDPIVSSLKKTRKKRKIL